MSGNTSISLSFFRIFQQADINDQVRWILFISDFFPDSVELCDTCTRPLDNAIRPRHSIATRGSGDKVKQSAESAVGEGATR